MTLHNGPPKGKNEKGESEIIHFSITFSPDEVLNNMNLGKPVTSLRGDHSQQPTIDIILTCL
jgi:hypothetical protein